MSTSCWHFQLWATSPSTMGKLGGLSVHPPDCLCVRVCLSVEHVVVYVCVLCPLCWIWVPALNCHKSHWHPQLHFWCQSGQGLNGRAAVNSKPAHRGAARRNPEKAVFPHWPPSSVGRSSQSQHLVGLPARWGGQTWSKETREPQTLSEPGSPPKGTWPRAEYAILSVPSTGESVTWEADCG